jgi:long-subunit acyl-CoA synthetase (AMP-forming)
VKPTIMLSVPLIIEKIYKAMIYPELNASALLRRLYGIPFFRKLLNRIAGKKLLKIRVVSPLLLRRTTVFEAPLNPPCMLRTVMPLLTVISPSTS